MYAKQGLVDDFGDNEEPYLNLLIIDVNNGLEIVFHVITDKIPIKIRKIVNVIPNLE